MAQRGAQIGNQNARKGFEWSNAIRNVLENYETSSIKRGLALREIARKVVEMALEGDHKAIEEIGNRIEGKAPQTVSIEGTNETFDQMQMLEVARRLAFALTLASRQEQQNGNVHYNQ